MNKGITHVLDTPCGGMVWQEPMLRRLANTHPALRYFGVDVVPSVIATNKQLGLPNARFALVNLASQRLPTESFFRRTPGLLFSRDALQHNVLGDVSPQRGDAVGGERPDRTLTGAAPHTALEKLSSAR